MAREKRKIDYKAEFYGLLVFIFTYTLIAMGASVATGVLLGNIVFFALAVPFYLFWRFVLIR